MCSGGCGCGCGSPVGATCPPDIRLTELSSDASGWTGAHDVALDAWHVTVLFDAEPPVGIELRWGPSGDYVAFRVPQHATACTVVLPVPLRRSEVLSVSWPGENGVSGVVARFVPLRAGEVVQA